MFCMQYKLCFSNKKLQKNWEWVKCLQFRSKPTLEIQKFNIRGDMTYLRDAQNNLSQEVKR